MFQRAVSALLVIGMTVFSAEAGGSKKTLMSSTNGDKITVTTVFDNYGVDVRLAKRWGFAAVISTPSATMLFDAGDDGATLLSNMKILGIDPRGIDSAFLCRPVIALIDSRDAGAAAADVVEYRFRHFNPHPEALLALERESSDPAFAAKAAEIVGLKKPALTLRDATADRLAASHHQFDTDHRAERFCA